MTRPNLLLIRADADTRMGTGHLMRCLALAQAWRAEGGQVVFLSHCESDALRRRITDAGMEFIDVPKSHPVPQDLQTTLQFLQNCRTQHSALRTPQPALRSPLGKEGSATWLVLDGYHFDPAYQQAIQSAGFRLLVIDDMAHLSAYHADIILNQNLGTEKLKYNCNPDTRLLFGPHYALLRQEFLSWHGWQRKIPKVARKVLVTMGGGDPDNVTLRVIRALRDIDVEAKIIVGGSNPHYVELKSEIRNLPCVAPRAKKGRKLEIIVNATNMPELMAWADVAATAGGSTCWEMAFMGLPSVVLTLAENQKAITENLDAAGVAVNLGWHEQVPTAAITKAINRLIRSPEVRNAMTCKGQALIDGLGTDRIVKKITAQSLILRRVTKSDCELLWEWINDPDVRASSFRSEYIPIEEHQHWFFGKIKDCKFFQLIGLNDDNTPVGQVRFDICEDEAEVDVSVARKYRGKGYSPELIRKGIQALLKETKVRTVHAFVKSENKASLQAFLKAGFVSQGMKIMKGHKAMRLTWRSNA